jgi:ribosomal protein S7
MITKLKLDSVKLEKKVRCTVCRTTIVEQQVIQVVRNAKKKIKAYICKPACAVLYENNPNNWSSNTPKVAF